MTKGHDWTTASEANKVSVIFFFLGTGVAAFGADQRCPNIALDPCGPRFSRCSIESHNRALSAQSSSIERKIVGAVSLNDCASFGI